MNLGLLSENINYISHGGISIGFEKLEFLKNSLVILQKDNHFRKVYYWGRINGYENDYHIAYGYVKDCLKDQLYYYSLNCLDWLLLPKVTSTARLLTPLVLNLFQGNPSIVTIINVPHKSLLQRLNDSNKNEVMNISMNNAIHKEKLKEEDRLAATIQMINENAIIIPRGSWYKHPNGDITENLVFSGLNFDESIQLKSYMHARLPQRQWNRNLLTRYDYNYSLDFLDTIDMDMPKECWSLQLYLGDNLVILKNLFWPGMIFYQKINSPHYGSIYVGDGKQNMDVPFMV